GHRQRTSVGSAFCRHAIEEDTDLLAHQTRSEVAEYFSALRLEGKQNAVVLTAGHRHCLCALEVLTSQSYVFPHRSAGSRIFQRHAVLVINHFLELEQSGGTNAVFRFLRIFYTGKLDDEAIRARLLHNSLRHAQAVDAVFD